MFIHLKYTDRSTIYTVDGEQVEFVGGRRSGDVVVNGTHDYSYKVQDGEVLILDDYNDLVASFENSDEAWEGYVLELLGVA